MNEFVEKIKKHKELWFIVPILMYVISFVLEYTYYQNFHINIVPYISPLGLIFSFASLLIGFFIVGSIHLISLIIFKSVLSEFIWKNKSSYTFFVPGLFILYLVQEYCELSLNYKFIIMNYIFMVMIVFGYHSFKTILNDFVSKLAMIFLLITILVSCLNGYRNFFAISGGLNSVSFKYNGKYVQSNSKDKIYIGETTDFLFLHDKEKKQNKVYKKSNIDSLVILQPYIKLYQGRIIHN